MDNKLYEQFKKETGIVQCRIEYYIEWLENRLATSYNSDYAIMPTASPKVCPDCESKNWHEETCEKCKVVHCHCDNCRQTFA